MKPHDPQTTAEWQEAVNIANFLRALYDCTLYGLIAPVAGLNIERCEDILTRGAHRGYRPTVSLEQMAKVMLERKR